MRMGGKERDVYGRGDNSSRDASREDDKHELLTGRGGHCITPRARESEGMKVVVNAKRKIVSLCTSALRQMCTAGSGARKIANATR